MKPRINIIAAAIILAAAFALYIFWPNILWERFVLIRRSRAAEKTFSVDAKQYDLRNGRLVVTDSGRIIWQSPFAWWVDDVQVADANNDGVVDVVMSVWKQGNFAKFKPFWVKTNDQRIRNHLFILDLKHGTMQPVWESSNLERPNCSIAIKPVGGDSGTSLVVTEGDYADWPACIPRYDAVWQWNGWGFTNQSRRPTM